MSPMTYESANTTTEVLDTKLLECVPLLKFDSDLEKPHLCDNGLFALSSLPPPVRIVTVIGDGRCGKSTLASRLSAEKQVVFPVGATGAAVTEGIDMCIVPRSSSSECTLVVLDCEGGNNPTGAIRGAVDLVAMLASTLIVQVVWGQMSEAQLLQIGQGIADRDRLLLGNNSATQRLPEHKLLLVVNGCHLEYAPNHINKALCEVHSGTAAARNELRAHIKKAFREIHFVTVPFRMDPSYQSKLDQVRSAVSEHCSPASLSGIELCGAQIAEMLKSCVMELRKGGAVPVPSVFRHVIYDHLLKPLVSQLLGSFKASLPDLSDGEYRPMISDTRHEVMHTFDHGTRQLQHTELVAEARDDLRRRADVAWQRILDQNTAVGDQDRDVSTESEMRYSHTEGRVVNWKRGCLGMGKTTPVVENASVFRVWTRTRVLKKNGTIAHSDWSPSAHSMDGSSCNPSISSAMNSTTSNSRGNWNSPGQVGERSCTPSSPLWNSQVSPGSPSVSRNSSLSHVSCRGNANANVNGC